MDASIFQCPRCGRYYTDASCYATELESDIERGNFYGKAIATPDQQILQDILGFSKTHRIPRELSIPIGT